MSSVCQQDKLNIVNIKLEVGDIHEAGVLVDVQDVRVESAQVEHVLHEPRQSKLKSNHLD